MGVKVTLGGIPIALEQGSTFSWTLSYGVAPSVSDLTTTAETADAIAALADNTFDDGRSAERDDPVGPLTLVIEDADNDRKVEILGVYVVESNRAGRDYNTRTLRLADRRWLWSRTHVERDYNLRRKTGDTRLVGGQMDRLEQKFVRPDVAYRPRTINPETQQPWTAQEILADVLNELCGGAGFSLDFADGGAQAPQLLIENLQLYDPGPEALSRVLSNIPGYLPFVDAEGIVRVRPVFDLGATLLELTELGAPISGDWNVVDKSQIRPRAFKVYFDREVELRFDYNENRTGTEQRATLDNPPRYLENVIINPLYQLTLANGDVVTQGEAVKWRDYIGAAAVAGNFSSLTPNLNIPLTEDVIRAFWLGNWSHLSRQWSSAGGGTTDQARLRYLSAIRTHYRQTFRIDRRWVDQIRALQPTRVAVLDPETGTRGPASVFCQYLVKVTQLGYSPNAGPRVAFQQDDYADNLDTRGPDAGNSPFTVEVLDSDAGIIRIVPALDQVGYTETFILGGVVDEDTLPRLDTTGAALSWEGCVLSQNFNLAVILTAVQDGPANIGRLDEVTVRPDEVIGIPVEGANRGPVWELRVTSETARYAWIDAFGQDIERAFRDGGQYPQVAVNGDDIVRLARATATALYYRLLDRAEGTVTYPLTPLEPVGNIQSVTHLVSVGRGNSTVLTTTLTMPSEVGGPNPFSFLPEGVRRKIRKLVQT